MAKKQTDDRPVQHTPVHLRDDTPDVFDPRHPAASSFAPLQPAAGVVADDVEEKGQNLRGGPTASQAHVDNLDQREKLQQQHTESLRASVPAAPTVNVEGDQATPAKAKGK